MVKLTGWNGDFRHFLHKALAWDWSRTESERARQVLQASPTYWQARGFMFGVVFCLAIFFSFAYPISNYVPGRAGGEKVIVAHAELVSFWVIPNQLWGRKRNLVAFKQ